MSTKSFFGFIPTFLSNELLSKEDKTVLDYAKLGGQGLATGACYGAAAAAGVYAGKAFLASSAPAPVAIEAPAQTGEVVQAVAGLFGAIGRAIK